MYRRLITGVAALSIAFTGFATAPARADSEDVAKVLTGLTALYIVGKIIKDDDRRVVAERNDNRAWGRYERPRTYTPYVRHRQLPLTCVRTVQTRKGEVQMLPQRCITRKVGRIDLPGKCERTIRGENGRKRVMYKRSCLERKGYRITARR